ncbi:MAG: hypothetical protein LBR25_06335 [Erysipelotrichaceae bacterium]|jgi:cell division protein FtsL|nr:hypothetical protein [Erysipelotrichaceae bacterium]
MAVKRIKRRKKVKVLEFVSLAVFGLALGGYILCAVFLHAKNVQMSKEIQAINAQITALSSSNEQLKIDIQHELSKANAIQLASDGGMTQDQNNVVYINEEE